MRKINITLLFLSIVTSAFGQQKIDQREKQRDSLMSSAMDEAALLYPRIRQFSITHQQAFSGKINSEFEGKPLFKGEYHAARTNINMSLPVFDGKKTSILGNLGVVHQFSSITDVNSLNSLHPVLANDTYIPMISLGAIVVHRDSLFNHPVTFTGSLNGLFNPSFSSRQITFTGLVTVPVISRPDTRLTAGLVVNIDPSSPAPAFILVSYYHKFKSSGMDLLIDAPYRVALRKEIKTRSSITLQSELGGNNSFFELNTDAVPKKLTFSTLELKSGLLFEHRITKKMVLSVSGGALSTLTSKVFEQGNTKANDYLIKNKQGTVPYAQVGISLLPFWKPFKK